MGQRGHARQTGCLKHTNPSNTDRRECSETTQGVLIAADRDQFVVRLFNTP